MLHAREITLGAVVLRIIMAEILGGVIGSERGRMNRPAGMRTYMLVSIGSSMVLATLCGWAHRSSVALAFWVPEQLLLQRIIKSKA